MKTYTKWELSYSIDGTDFSKVFPAKVPGSCQLDFAKNFGLPDYNISENILRYDGLEKLFWKYSTTIPTPEKNKKIFFVSKGIDYEFEIFIDDKKVFYQEGMFTPVSIEIKPKYFGKALSVKIFPSPKRIDADKGTRREADRCYKPDVCYGWDFQPRLITQGIWDETYFETKEESYISNLEITYNLYNERKNVKTYVNYSVFNGVDTKLKLTVSCEDSVVYEDYLDSGKEDYSFDFKNVKLWWCVNYGEQNLYTFRFDLLKNNKIIDTRIKEIGFREVKLVSQAYSWSLWEMPFTQAYVPITIELNGVQIFAKGSNFVSPEIFHSEITKEEYERLLLALKDMNANIVRVWGGAIICKDSFYEICDKEGILVWQDFQLSCNKYSDDEHYLTIVKQEATTIIKRLREHPSLVIWCGGNELYIGAENTPQSHVIRLLNSLCYQFDKNTPFLDSTPMYGMKHGHYVFRDSNGVECIKLFKNAKATAYVEFGCPSMCSYSILEKTIPADKLNLESLLNKDSVWQTHHAVGTWDGESWLQINNIEYYFGKTKDLLDAVNKSQLLQLTGKKFMFEEARRQKFNCSIVMDWCFNEPYPNSANNCLISYYFDKKPAYFGVKESLKDTVLSASFDKFSWRSGEELKFDVYLLHDGYKKIKDGKFKITIELNNDIYEITEGCYSNIHDDENLFCGKFSFKLPKTKSCIMKLKLISDDGNFNNEYRLLYYGEKDSKEIVNNKNKKYNIEGIDL